MFRWGILSTATIAREDMIPAIQASSNGTVAAIASQNPGRAGEVGERFSIPKVFDSYEALLASDAVDGVYIPVPTSQHVEWTRKAIAAGKHVLCEKPISLDASVIDGLIEARDEAGVLVAEAFMITHHPQWAHVRDLIANGVIGRVRHVSGVFTYFNDDPDSTRNRLDMGGGGLPDIGVYPILATRFATGVEPRDLRASVTRHPDWGTDVFAEATLRFPGFALTFHCATQLALRQSMVFHGEDGVIELDAPFNAGKYGPALVHLDDQHRSNRQTTRFLVTDQYQLQAEAFAKAALDGDHSGVMPLEGSRANQRVIDAIYRAGVKGTWVRV